MKRMRTYQLDELDNTARRELCRRPSRSSRDIIPVVEPILEAVRKEGDRAVHRYTKEFDGVDIDPILIRPSELAAELTTEEKKALDTAMRNVERFHREQHRGTLQVETAPGIRCMREVRPIESVGLYIPGGTAPLPSTAVMLGVPARVAGCRSVVMATPPGPGGTVPAPILYVAQQTGVDAILLAGGAQAIAAMAYGTESIPKADKLFGPGNQYVTAAKMALQNSDAMISIDLPAGPSEVLVIADREADPDFIAADLLSQAEHGPDSQVVLVALPGLEIDSVEEALERQLARLPRAEITRQALEKSFAVRASSMEEALEFSNRYAPEHLILNIAGPGEQTDRILNAGSVFLGPWTPESFGDYASGTNHTLPTYGYARMYSGVSLESFQKSITFQEATPEGVRTLGPVVEQLATMEGLDAHREAVSLRLRKLNETRPDGSGTID